MSLRYSKVFMPILMASCCIATSCFKDNEEDLYADYLANCEVSSSSFRNDVLPILQVTCYSCHDESNAPIEGDGIDLDGYQKMKDFENEFPGEIVGSLKHSDGSSEMPKGDKKLDVCNIRRVEVWILEGMPDN